MRALIVTLLRNEVNAHTKPYGNLSIPPFENILHLKIRLIDKNNPFSAPYFVIASIAYDEHEG